MLYLSFLQVFSRSLQPIVLIPPFYGSNLYATYEANDFPWYCPKKMNDELIWVDATMFVSKRKDCLCKLLTPRLDENGNIYNWRNISIYTKDFGGESSVRYAANAKIFNFTFVESMATIIDFFKERGYEVKKDLFIAPYDFRISPAFSDDFHKDLKILIENASKINNQKVTLFGFSLGGFNAQVFLSRKVDQEWKSQYIEQLILLAPSFVGSVNNLLSFWTRSSPLVPYYHADELKALVEGWPSIHAHNPNHFVFRNRTVLIGADGKNYTVDDVYRLALEHNIIRPKFVKMYERSYELTSSYPEGPGLKTTLLYNAGLQTTDIIDLRKGWDKWPVEYFDSGDGRLPGHGFEWVCKNWKNISCLDFNQPKKSYEHQALISNKHVIEAIFNVTNAIPLIPQEEEIVIGEL